MKKIGYNNWLINQQKENKLKRYKKITMYRRYWDATNQEYTWESTLAVDIDNDIIKCGKTTWKADTDQLNVWKMGNLTLTVDNSHGKWDENNASGYFDGYMAFLSMIRVEVGFVAKDGTIYEIFAYQGLISADGIQLENDKHTAKIKIISLDYLLKSVDANQVSTTPVSPQLQYENSDIYSATTIGKTGSGWTVNAYQYKIVRIFSGTGIGQERMIASNTADTLTVNTWVTTPDATSDFEIVGEYLGVGTGAQVDYVTTQPGVGKITNLWTNDDLKEQGEFYSVSDLNEPVLGATSTFKTAPVIGVRITVDYFYWYQSQTFKFLIEKILDLANISNRYIQDVVFSNSVEKEWEQTTQADFQAGTSIQTNLTRYPDNIIIDDDRSTVYRDQYSEPNDIQLISSDFFLSGSPYAHSFKAYKSAYFSKIELNAYYTGMAHPAHDITFSLCADDAGGDPGTVIIEDIFHIPITPVGYKTLTFDMSSFNYRMTYGTKYFWKISTTDLYRVDFFYSTGGTEENHKMLWNGLSWDHSSFLYTSGDYSSYKYYYNPYYNYGVNFSQTLDCGVSLTSYGKLIKTETLNSGSSIYYTQSSTTDSGWSTVWDADEWDQVDEFGNILSDVKRYIRVAVYFTPNYPGGGVTTDDIDTPFIHDFNLKYYVAEYKPTLANFTDKDGKSAIETMGAIGNYDMGFYMDFDDSEKMVWDIDYDGAAMPQTEGWTENKEYNGVGSIVSSKLEIEGTSSLSTVGTISDAGHYIWNKVCLVEYSGNLYMSSGAINTVYRYDGGTTWVSIGSLPETTITSVTSLISFNGNLYAGVTAATTGERGVYRYDGGTTWTKVSNFPSSVIAVYSLHEYDGDMYAGTSYGTIYRYDGGSTWTQVGNFASTYYRIRWMSNYNGSLYACMDNNASDGGAIYIYNGGSSWSEVRIFNEGRMGAMIVCGNYLYVGTAYKIYQYNGSTFADKGLNVINQIGSFGVHNERLYIGTESNSHFYVYDEKTLTDLYGIGDSVWGQVEFNNKLYIGLGVLSTEVREFEGAGHCFYDIVDTDLDPRNGWTVEANVEKTLGLDENFQIVIADGTFITKVAITNSGYIKLLEYDKDDLDKSKKAAFLPGGMHLIKIARKGTKVKIYVDSEVVLISYANNSSAIQKVYFGQIEDTSESYQCVIDLLKYSDSVPCFETFYLPKYYFQNKNSIVDSGLYLKPDENYIKLYNYKSGWDRIYNYINATYGEYSSSATPFTELDDHPTSIDKYGKRELVISGEEFLQAEDTNVAVGASKIYYQEYKNPRRTFKLLCKYLFQLNLSDKIYVSAETPIQLTDLQCKVVGLVLDIDKFTLEIDCEEIL